MSNTTVTLEGVFFRTETDAAWCIDYQDHYEVWLPKSCVECDEEIILSLVGGFTIRIPEWLAYKRELI
ncbi:hypothetical protein LCGC14_1915040 [marine sediment metagenome]|uniref:Uncharacterized protein n=1 Tax=marine sediment metagenome TaxID=412755 RepID=A0A0F9GFR2_9ZZZZ